MKFTTQNKWIAMVLSLSVIAATAAQAQNAQQAPATQTAQAKGAKKLPAAKKVVASYIKAMGGKKTLDKYRTRVSKGTVEVAPMNARGTVEVTQIAPNKVVTTMNVSGLGTFQSGFDGTMGWAKDSISGLRELQGGELAATRRAAEFSQANLEKLYPKMVVTGRDKVGEREVYVVEATPAEGGTPSKMYFDVQNGLLLRTDSVIEGPQGKISTQSYFEDYRTVDGIKMPFTVRQSLGAVSFIIKFTEVKHDVAVNDTLFAKPTA